MSSEVAARRQRRVICKYAHHQAMQQRVEHQARTESRGLDLLNHPLQHGAQQREWARDLVYQLNGAGVAIELLSYYMIDLSRT